MQYEAECSRQKYNLLSQAYNSISNPNIIELIRSWSTLVALSGNCCNAVVAANDFWLALLIQCRIPRSCP